jgi:cysteine desulfurase / selenocysteine lyase
MLDLTQIRKEFPVLHEKVNGMPLVYFDNGATSQKPMAVINELSKYYSEYNSNIHRGVHKLSQVATEKYEAVRTQIQQYLNVKHNHEIIFTKGTTDSINLVAHSLGQTLNEGDEILVSEMEHHSNIVPWQMLEQNKGVKVVPVSILEDGSLDMDSFNSLLNPKVKLVSITHISNALGSINPIKEIISKSHNNGSYVLIDGAQSIQHMPVDIQKLDCDFYVFSGHKIFGPTGTGVLFGKEEILNSLPPYQGGGDMIKEVSFKGTTFNTLPHKFEAGTPNIAGVIGLGAAFRYMKSLPWNDIIIHEKDLLDYATSEITKIEGVKIIGTANNKASVLSFIIDDVHHFDLGTLLDQQGIAVRTGHHCAQPIMEKFEIKGTIRASFAFYNTKEEVDVFIKALKKALNMLR